ncbi:sugar porter (SP) family MFS transporter [Penicillium maclennaniae]|uniref:sugar porter (SP) family MFS transporter n=1 Tax=Penicillium maclennaniae TaxID=1343394 RepID=UPI002540CB61|nr:sugar porter (SP) family MFS transporter [Penicillium maclennaniae]KAJ5675231.1 sugar porter (SP) family MFS transporter [Penicillium maclennaniae]
MHGIMFGVGYSLAGWIGVGTYFYTPTDMASTFPWRFPLAFHAVPALVLLAGIPFLPASPRWLLEKNRPDEARVILERLYRTKHSDSMARLNSHFDQMLNQLQLDRAIRSERSHLEIFRTSSNRRRALVGAIVMFGNQLTGVYVNSSYGVLIYNSLGFSGSWPLILAAIWVSCSIPGNIWAALTVDRYGRVRLMLIGLVGTACTLLCECTLQALYLNSDNSSGKKAAVFFVFLSIFFWSFFIDAVQYVYLSEIFPTRIRSQGMALGMVAYYTALIIILIAGPIALEAITWRFFTVLLAITCVQTVLVFFLCPETKQTSLDVMNGAFGEPATMPDQFGSKSQDCQSADIESHHLEHVVRTNSESAAR